MYIDLTALNDGLTQDERRVKALMPGFIRMDERNIQDLLKFMTELASQFNYYNVNNKVEGSWDDFFLSDIHLLLILISKFDMSAHIRLFARYEDALYLAEDDKSVYAALKDLFDFVLYVFNMLKELQHRFSNVSNRGKISHELFRIVSSFDDELTKLVQYNEEARRTFGEGMKVNAPEAGAGKQKLDSIFDKGASDKERIINALPAIKSLFNDLSTKYNHLVGITSFYLKNHDLLEEEYVPHLALSIAFLHLYMHLQRRLNQTTRHHLEFYYKKILGLQLHKALPDQVHLVMEKDPGVPYVSLNAGAILLATVPGKEPVPFTLDEPLNITAAQIVELKTLCLADHLQFKNASGTVKETQVYNGDYTCISAAAFLKNKAPVKTWPVLGEDQEGKPDASRTMDITRMGLMLSSPVLYLPEGRRTIVFYLYMEDESVDMLIAYFSNYAKVTNKEALAVSHQLLSTAFLIDYTDVAGWQEIPRYSAVLNIELRRLEIEIQINNADQVVAVYQPGIHGGDYDISCPAFRLLLNNFSVNNPFTFLRTVKIRRISITAEVKGSRAVKLQNNIGPLNPAGLGQPFGPQPSVGAYLDIKSSNIFNTYTRSFCIRIDWVDLPKEPGGWETYYQGYNNHITNSSFRIKISTLTDGHVVPKPPLQQEFSLFETDNGGMGILSSATQLQNIDIKRLGFVKKPLLDKEETAPEKNFAEGAVRLELVAPKDAFGHRLFPQLFPQIVLHNAKKSKKLPLPNQPYIPQIRSISIDYTLEHSEVLNSGSAKSNTSTDMKVFHLYPFGYEEIYPGKKRSPYNLIPDFDHENNLYIGLEEVKPGQELPILFQLEENNFTDLAKDTETVFWSYLEDNNWIYLTEKDVLADGTNNFINTGIVKIKLPTDFQRGNTILSPRFRWLRASAKGRTNIKSNIIGIYTQAVAATRIPTNKVDATHIPPGAVKMFKSKVDGLQAVLQPFASFGGKRAETEEQFYIRVSERLRHNQKLLTSRDIEQMILERFPQILMAKCINPQEYTVQYGEELHPNPRVILIPKEQENGLFLSDEPKVNLSIRYQVKKFLEKSMSSFLKVDVENPVYEKLKVICTVKFTEDGLPDTGMYIRKLQEDIKRYLCPWLYNEGRDFTIGGGIYMADLLNYIKKRPYIKYVTGFSIVHFYFSNAVPEEGSKARIIDYANDDDVYIKGSLPEAVLIPSSNHLITVEDEMRYADARKIGISELEITDELLVARGGGNIEQEPTTPVVVSENLFDLFINHNLD